MPPIAVQRLFCPAASDPTTAGHAWSCCSSRHDGSVEYRLAWDGRLDNRAELIERLRQAGQPAQQSTDAEIVAAVYATWGPETFAMLLGDFALALWDRPNRRLVCARDPIGQRPLFYHVNPSRFVAASSIRRLLADADTPNDLSHETVIRYLAVAMPHEAETFYRGIKRLPAGHWLEATGDATVRVHQYWDPIAAASSRGWDRAGCVDQFRHAFLDSVRARLSGSRHAAVHVSGGFDSSSIAAAVHHCNAASQLGLKISAITHVARAPAADERRYVEQLLNRYPMPVIAIEAADSWAFRADGLSGRWQDEPYASPYAARLVEELGVARGRGIDVILAGTGGDELGGSSWYLVDLLQHGHYKRFVAELKARAAVKGQSSLQLLRTLLRFYLAWMKEHRMGSVLHPPHWLKAEHQVSVRAMPRDRTSAAFQHPARFDILRRLQHCWIEPIISSMRGLYGHFGVELALPFLDRRLVEWALAAPPFELGEKGLLKAPMRQAMADLLPAAIANRPDKSDYLCYWDLGIRCRERRRIQLLFHHSIAGQLGFFDERRLASDYDLYCRGRSMDRQALWRAITLEAWLRHMNRPSDIDSDRCLHDSFESTAPGRRTSWINQEIGSMPTPAKPQRTQEVLTSGA